MGLSHRKLMKTDRIALLIVVIALVILGVVTALKGCSDNSASEHAEPIIIVDTVYVKVHSVSDSTKHKRRRSPQKDKNISGSDRNKSNSEPQTAPKRDYTSETIHGIE